MRNAWCWGAVGVGLALPGPAAGQEATRSLTWALVGATPGRTAVVVSPVDGELRRDATPAVSQDANGAFRLDLIVPAASPAPPSEVMVSGVIPANPTYVVRLPVRLSGQRIVGERRVTTLFDPYSWNLWHGGVAAYGASDARRNAPSTVGLNVADAKRIVVDGLGVPARHVKIRGPRNGVVVRQSPARTAAFDPRSSRFTFVTAPVGERRAHHR